MPAHPPQHLDRSGLAFALGAHVIWGSMPLYLMLVHSVPAVEFVAWRLVFTLPLCLAIIAIRKSGTELRAVFANRKALLTLVGSSAMIAINWLLYVWSIQTNHIYAASIGYYILPLTMMLFGLVFLHERLTRRQWGAVALAGIAVAALAAGALTTLWLSLSMAVSFGIYGLLRKTVSAGPLAGLTVETMILMPLAIVLIAWFWNSPAGTAMTQGPGTALSVAFSGVMTGVPLLLFASAARRLPYTVVGFLQFLSPTVVFLYGVFVFGEELKPAQLVAFVMIWAAAALFSWDLFRGARPPSGNEEASRGAAT